MIHDLGEPYTSNFLCLEHTFLIMTGALFSPIPVTPNFYPGICLLKGKLIPSQPSGVGIWPRLNQSLLSILFATVIDLGVDILTDPRELSTGWLTIVVYLNISVKIHGLICLFLFFHCSILALSICGITYGFTELRLPAIKIYFSLNIGKIILTIFFKWFNWY